MLTLSECSVTLRGGMVVPVEALRVAWALEARGFRFELAGADVVIRPGSALTEADVATIQAHKPALRTLLAYFGAAPGRPPTEGASLEDGA